MSAGRIRRERRSGKGKALDSTLEVMLGYLFRFIAIGTHVEAWQLSSDEAQLLAEALADCARALSSKKFKAVESALGKVAPWLSLAGAATIVITPRVRAHNAAVRAAREGRANVTGESAGDVVSGRDASGSGAASGDGYAATTGGAGARADDGAGRGPAVSAAGQDGLEFLGELP